MPLAQLKIVLSIATLFALSPLKANDAVEEALPTPTQSLQWLEEGNVRFQAGATEGPRRDDVRRSETFTKGQHPFAAVLACADSRVPPELLFDAGIGDLFVVRVAGNVADVDEIGTIEYGVEHLHIPLIVIVGHSKCGAVTAVVEGNEVPPNIAKLVDNIAPAVETTRKRFSSLKGPALVQQSVRMNVRQAMTDTLRNSEIIRDAVSQGHVKLIGAVYDINSGSVEWMGPHPDEAALLAKPTEGIASIDEHGGELIKPATPTHDTEKPKPDAPALHEPKDAHAKPADPHAKPAAKNAHGTEAAHSESEPHAAKDAATDEHGEHDAHAEQHPTTQPSEKTSQAPQPHNFMALGGCLAGGALLSMLTIHLVKPKKAAAPVTE